MATLLSLAVSLGSLTIVSASNCTKHSCIFSAVTHSYGVTRCGQVDAASRMPADIFQDPDAVEKYVNFTVKFYYIFFSYGMEQLPCAEHTVVRGGKTVGPFRVQHGGYDNVSWTSPGLMAETCEAFCGCQYKSPGRRPLPSPPAPPLCKDDIHDAPLAHKYCSLCGPKFNAPVHIDLYYEHYPPTSEEVVRSQLGMAVEAVERSG